MKKVLIIFLSLCISSIFAQKPNQDKGTFKQFKTGYYQNYILKGIQDFEEPVKVNTEKYFKQDLTGQIFPKDLKSYKKYWHGNPVSQANTNTCWSFSSTSFYESEVYRLTGQKVRISEMYTVYWEYIEKARRFVREHGNSAVAEGSEGNAVTRIFEMYGAVPYDTYTGLKSGQKYLDHSKLIEEISNYLKSIKETNNWNEEVVLATIKSILVKFHHVVNGSNPPPFSYGA